MSRWTQVWLIAAVAALVLTIMTETGSRRPRRVSQAAPAATARLARGADGIPGAAPGGWRAPTIAHGADGSALPPDFATGGAKEADGAVQPLLAGGPGGRRRNPREPEIFDLLRNSGKAPVSPRIRELANEATAGETNSVGKARAIYDWITRNIVYDTAEWESIASGAKYYIHDHDPDSVVERGTTVCIGYAWLFDKMCEAEGIEATWLIGDVRGYRGTSDETLVDDIRHAWNAVRLDDGEWHLLDATWGALQEGESESEISRDRADYYFDTPAGQFVYDHLPEDSGWQLLDEPLPAETAFQELPNLKPAFFMNGLGIDPACTSVLRARAGTRAALPFSAPDGVDVAATIGSHGNPDSFRRIAVRNVPGENAGAAIIPELPAGDYVLRIYSGAKGRGTLECSADFLIRAQ